MIKPKTFTFLLILFIHQLSFGQWEEKNISTTTTLNSVHFLEDEIGFAAGENEIFKTIDGAESWETSYTGNNLVLLNDVFIIEENIIIAAGKNFLSNSSFIIKSSNNGEDWTEIDISQTSILQSIFFVSPTIGYCAGSGGVILKSIDSGDTWQELDSGTFTNINSIYFINDSVGVAVGGGPNSSVILKTISGGNSWTPIESPSDNNLLSTFFINEQVGYAVGWGGEIIKTEDCGSSWIFQSSVDMTGNLEVFFVDESNGYIVGGNMADSRIQKTVDGGELWENISPNLPIGLTSLYFSSFDVGYAVGTNGTVLKTETGGVMTSIDDYLHNKQIVLFPNPAANFVTIESSENEIIELVRIYDNTGKLINEIEEKAIKIDLNLSNYPSGVYYLELNTEGSKSISKLIKEY